MNNIDSETIANIVLKIVGPVRPVCESHADGQRLANIGRLTSVVDQLLMELHDIAYTNKDRYEASAKAIGNHAHKFFEYILSEYEFIEDAAKAMIAELEKEEGK